MCAIKKINQHIMIANTPKHNNLTWFTPNWAMSTMVGFLYYSFIVFLAMGVHYAHIMIFNKNPNLPNSFYVAVCTYLSIDIQLRSYSSTHSTHT